MSNGPKASALAATAANAPATTTNHSKTPLELRWRSSEASTSSRTASIWRIPSVKFFHLVTLVARNSRYDGLLDATPFSTFHRHGAPELRRTMLNAFDSPPSFLSRRGSVQPWSFGSGQDANRLSYQVFRTSRYRTDVGWVSSNIWDRPGRLMALRGQT